MKQTVDVTDIVEAMCALLGRWAVPHKDVKPRRHNVEARRGVGEKEGHVLFRFMSRDDFMIELDVDIAELAVDPRGYMDRTMGLVVEYVEQMRARRQEMTRSALILPSNEVLH